jgi:hypothetical protein
MTDLYVSMTGSDGNNGSQNAPFATILAASQHAQSGTTIHVAPGTYQGGFTTTANGTAAAHITYVSDTQWGAKIVGGPVTNSAAAGWWNQGNYVDVKGFEIDGSNAQAAANWQYGFYDSGSHDTFQNGSVHDILRDITAFNKAEAAAMGGAAIEMDSYAGGVDGSVIGNLAYNIGPDGLHSDHTQGIYQSETGVIRNNIIYNVVGDGIVTWHAAQNINISNNTIDNARDAGIVVGSGDSGSSSTTGDYINTNNNIVVNSANGIVENGITGIHNTYVDNLVYGVQGSIVRLQNGLRDVGTVQADPMFVNAAGHDYHLRAGSPAINAGTASGAPATDFDGNARPQGGAFDIGAYEFTSSSTPPPAPPPTAPPPVVTPDTLVLLLSEDRYRGDAQFIAKIDGTKIAGPTAATVLHSSGQSQTFTYNGLWGPGHHDLEIDFINDRYAGPGKDRNLYVDQVRYDGASYLSHTDALRTNGAIHILIGN